MSAWDQTSPADPIFSVNPRWERATKIKSRNLCFGRRNAKHLNDLKLSRLKQRLLDKLDTLIFNEFWLWLQHRIICRVVVRARRWWKRFRKYMKSYRSKHNKSTTWAIRGRSDSCLTVKVASRLRWRQNAKNCWEFFHIIFLFYKYFSIDSSKVRVSLCIELTSDECLLKSLKHKLCPKTFEWIKLS